MRARVVWAIAATVMVAARCAWGGAPASGGADGAWVVASPRLGGAVVVYVDAGAGGGEPTGMIVARFATSPVALAAGEKSVVAAFAPESAGDAAFRSFRRVGVSMAQPGVEVFTRPEALPPLPSMAPVTGMVVVDDAVVVLTPSGLWVLRDAAWRRHELPAAVREADEVWAVRAQGRMGIVARGPGERAVLATAALAGAEEEPEWSVDSVAVPPRTRQVLSVASQLLAVSMTEGGDGLEISLIRPTDWIVRATVPAGDGAPSVAALGDRVLVVRGGDEDPLRTDVRVVGLDGATVFEGSLRSASPLSPQDLQLVVFGVMGVIVAAMLFALRSEASAQISLPEGWAIAPPMRRFAAVVIDQVPGAAVAVALSAVRAAGVTEAEAASTALAAGFFVTVLTSAVGEAVFSRTLGKWALGLRTITVQGERPSWAQALGRTLAKLVFPPISLLILFHPTIPPPGSCGTTVIVRRRVEGESGPKGG